MPKLVPAIAFCALVLAERGLFGQNSGTKKPEATYSVLADSLLQRAQAEVDRVKGLVAEGILPRSQLAEAERRLADAQDQDTLARTLYGSLPVEKMTPEQARDMHEAAERRVSRQEVDIDAARTCSQMASSLPPNCKIWRRNSRTAATFSNSPNYAFSSLPI